MRLTGQLSDQQRGVTPDQAICPHLDFIADVTVSRLEDSGRFQADVKIECSHCHLPFRFLGLPGGLDLNGAAVSLNAEEARLAILPRGKVLTVLDGAPQGFSVKRVD